MRQSRATDSAVFRAPHRSAVVGSRRGHRSILPHDAAYLLQLAELVGVEPAKAVDLGVETDHATLVGGGLDPANQVGASR